MIGVTQLFVIATALAALLTMISIWAPRRLAVKIGALITAALFLPLIYASFTDLLSKPKPVAMEWWLTEAAEATVLGSSIEEDRAIYVWLQLDGLTEPRAYALPWNRETAEQLQKAEREAEQSGGDVRMGRPFEPSRDEAEPIFHAQPQEALPPKEVAQPEPQYFLPSDGDA